MTVFSTALKEAVKSFFIQVMKESFKTAQGDDSVNLHKPVKHSLRFQKVRLGIVQKNSRRLKLMPLDAFRKQRFMRIMSRNMPLPGGGIIFAYVLDRVWIEIPWGLRLSAKDMRPGDVVLREAGHSFDSKS